MGPAFPSRGCAFGSVSFSSCIRLLQTQIMREVDNSACNTTIQYLSKILAVEALSKQQETARYSSRQRWVSDWNRQDGMRAMPDI
ncbi:hypothetical protein BCR43DRAFT_489489 [Syncephalastrum racemosum]|uniref:Uncharacterized protein n=1 Tax=Syncephalastrum racemosum TaxID=13706 RepID=A0A1X2HEB4_SYNRA|nr:hypothetical protein BCR43DRAFT_489489 [Syncephalastrum racemosum]